MRFLLSMCSRFLSSVSFGFCFEGSLHDRRKFRSETSDNMDRWKAQPGESQKREDQTSTTTSTLRLQLHCAACNHLSVHQWVRSAIHHSQQRTSSIIGFRIFETSATALCGTTGILYKIFIYLFIYLFMFFIYLFIYLFIYIYIYIKRERER